MSSLSKSSTPKATRQSVHLPPAVSGVLASGGESLPGDVQTEMGARFGHDFSKVRIHADSGAAHSAQALGAQAYTFGQDIAFGPGKFAPETRRGRQLLAHELTHVVQQGRGIASAESAPTQALEHDAHRAAAAFADGSAPIQVSAASAPRISMAPDAVAPAAQAVSAGELAKSLQTNIVKATEESTLSALIEEVLAETDAEGKLVKNISVPPAVDELAKATGSGEKLIVSLEELVEDLSQKLKEEELVEEILESVRKKEAEKARKLLQEMIDDLDKQEQLAKTIESSVEKTSLPAVTETIAQKSVANPVLTPAVNQVVTQAAKPRTALDIPTEGIDMPWVGNGGVSSSELGYLRDSKYYWNEYAKQWGHQFSPDNLDRIKNGNAPMVDDTWLKAHPEHVSYKGQRLEHHHLGQGARAVPLPEKLHDAYTTFHPRRQVVGEGARPLQPIRETPAGWGELQTNRHIRQGRIADPNINPAAPPKHDIPRSSALAGVPEKDLKPVKPDTGVDSAGRATKKPAEIHKPAASTPPKGVVEVEVKAIEAQSEQGLEAIGKKVADETAQKNASSAAEKPLASVVQDGAEKPVEAAIDEGAEKRLESAVEQNVEKRIEAAAEEGVEQRMEKQLESAIEETVEKNLEKRALKSAEGQLEERAVKFLESSVVEKTAKKATGGLVPVIGWYFSGKDMLTGVEDIAHGNFFMGIGTIGVAAVDVAADALHLGDAVSGVGGTALSLTVQAWTTAMQAGFEMARVQERSKELREYIHKNGKLPPRKELMGYYGLNDEDVLLMEEAMSGTMRIRLLTELPQEQMDLWVFQQAKGLAQQAPNPANGLPDIATEKLESYIKARIAELEKQAATASPDAAQKIQEQRDAWAKFLPQLKAHIDHENEVNAKREKEKKIREYKEWKARVEAQKKADAAKDNQPQKTVPPVPGSASPFLPQEATPQAIGPFSLEKSPMQKAGDAVKTFENWGLDLKIKGTALVNRIHKGASPSNAERKAYATELTNWQSWLGKTISDLQQKGRSEAVAKLIAIRDNEPGPKLIEIRGLLL